MLIKQVYLTITNDMIMAQQKFYDDSKKALRNNNMAFFDSPFIQDILEIDSTVKNYMQASCAAIAINLARKFIHCIPDNEQEQIKFVYSGELLMRLDRIRYRSFMKYAEMNSVSTY